MWYASGPLQGEGFPYCYHICPLYYRCTNLKFCLPKPQPTFPPQILRFNKMSTELPLEKSNPTSKNIINKFFKNDMILFFICEKMAVFFIGGNFQTGGTNGSTPWDLGGPTPLLVHLHSTGSLPIGRALVPGCGSVSLSLCLRVCGRV